MMEEKVGSESSPEMTFAKTFCKITMEYQDLPRQRRRLADAQREEKQRQNEKMVI